MKKNIIRLLSLVLSMLLCIGVIPVQVIADGNLESTDVSEPPEIPAAVGDDEALSESECTNESLDKLGLQYSDDEIITPDNDNSALLENNDATAVETDAVGPETIDYSDDTTQPDSAVTAEGDESYLFLMSNEQNYNGYICTVDSESANVSISESGQGGNQAILMAIGGNEFDAIIDISVTDAGDTQANATLKAELLKGESAMKYRIVKIISANEAEQVSDSELSEDGELHFVVKGDGIYVLVRLKGVELDPSTTQGSPAFFAEVVSGARKTGEDYVWTADNSASGHRFVFRINYRFILYSDCDVDNIHMIIPKRIIKDRIGEYADGIELSVPSQEEVENDGELDENVYFAWREELNDLGEPTGNIIIYNFKTIQNGAQSGSIELAYYMTESTLEYRDYDPDEPELSRSDEFHCKLLLKNKTPLDSEHFTVCINTTASVTSLEKGRNDSIWLYNTWMNYWGDAEELGITNPNSSKFIMWLIKAEIFATQPYDLSLSDQPMTEGLEAVALKWVGENEFIKPDSDGTWKKHFLSNSPVYAYVITRVDESLHKDLITGQEVEKWTVQNKAVVTVQGIDGVDDPSYGTDLASYTYEVPIFNDKYGHFDAWKRGDGACRAYEGEWWRWTTGADVILNSLNIFTDTYSRYDLDRFGVHNGNQGELEAYDGFDYAVWMWGTPYILTKDWNYSDVKEKNNGYFRDYTIYDQWDFDVKLGHSASDVISIGAGDYRIKNIQFNVLQYDAKLNASGLDFYMTSLVYDKIIDENDTQGGIGDVLHIFGKTGAGEWVELLRKDYRSGGDTWVNSEYAELSPNGKEIVLKESQDHSKDILLYRTVMKTRHYWTSIGTVPEFELFPSERVLNIVNESDVICLFNDTYADLYSTWEGQTKNVEFDSDSNVSNVFYTGSDYREYKWDDFSGMNIDLGDGDTRDYYRYFHIYDSYRRDYDYARTSVSNSSLVKRITSTSNDRKMARFTIGWQVDMTETIMSSRDGEMVTENILQKGGTFYDLLPKGAALDLRSVKVLASNNELDYQIEQVSNWRGSGRTMLIVKVLNHGVNYSLSYETIHAWTSIKDYGNDVYNPVAYETGNVSIANGKPDDGSGFAGVSDNMRSWMRDLDDECGEHNRFLYSDTTTSIVAVIAVSNGISKRVKSLSDTAFGGMAYVEHGGVYIYRLSYSPDSMVHAKNLMFIDNVEDTNASGRQWQGSLYSADPEHPENAIDVSQLKSAGVNPTVYFSDHIVSLNNYGDDQTAEEYLAEKGFIVSSEFFENHTLADVKSFAVYCGDSFELKGTEESPNKQLTVLIYMKSPEYIPEKGNPYPATFNNFALNMRVGVSGESGVWEYIPHLSITPDVVVYSRIMQDVPLLKVSEENESYVISNVKFKLIGRSFYTGEQIELYAVTGPNGKLTFRGVERGSYILEEVDCPKDWVLKKQPYQVLIDGYGRLWISELGVFKTADGIVETDSVTGNPLMLDGSIASYDYERPTVSYDPDVFTVTNEPRVYTDFSFYKIGMRSGNPLEGVEFRLEGISHYNREIEMTSVSNSDGLVTFENLEWGTYTLTEIQCADGYKSLPSNIGIRVEVAGNSLVSVFEYDTVTGQDKAEREWITVSLLGDVMIKNPEKHSDVVFYKAEQFEDSYRYLPGAKFSLKGSSSEGTAVYMEAVSEENGVVRFTALEEGIYEIREIEPPKNIRITDNGDAISGGTINYQGDPNTYLVTISSDGSFRINLKDNSGIGAELAKNNENNYVFLNKPLPEGEIIITKKWSDSLTGNAAANRPYPQLTLVSESAFASNYYTVRFDAFGGYFPTGGTSYALRYRADELPSAADTDSVPTPLRSNYLFVGWVYRLSGSDEVIPFSLSEYREKASITVYAKWVPYRVWNYSYKPIGDFVGEEQKFTAPVTGDYLLEAWGANGGDSKTSNGVARTGGHGAYTSGTIHLEAGQTLYIYVGGRGSDGVNCPRPTSPRDGVFVLGGWNGGGMAVSDTGWSNDDTSGSGGGATDFRLVKGNTWDSFDSLKSRIMVAGGGGGPVAASGEALLSVYKALDGQAASLPKWTMIPGRTFCYKAGITADGKYSFSSEAPSDDNLYSPIGDERISGSFGAGASGYKYRYNLHSIGGGGGGWYGGCAGSTYYADSYTWIRSFGASASGGTSYISGHEGCLAIDQTSSQGNISHLTTSEFSGFVFTDTTMLAGYEIGTTHPNPDTTGNGYARITYIVSDDVGAGVVYPAQSLTPASGSISSEDEIKSISSTEKTDIDGNITPGYWEKVSDDTWVYHFNVVDPTQDYVVFEDEGLVYTAYNYHYVSDEMTPGYVELPGQIMTATITNSLPTGSIIITKQLSGGNSEQKFRFVVTLMDGGNRPVNGVFGGISFQNGTGVLAIRGGESFIIGNIPAGYRFSVDEEALVNYTKSFTPANPSGIVEANAAIEIICQNTYVPPTENPVDVTLLKIEAGHFETPGTYSIRADFRNLVPNTTYSYSTGGNSYSFVSDRNGCFNGLLLSLKHGEYVVFENLPVGSQYKFSEPDVEYISSFIITDALGGTSINQSSSVAVETDSDLSTAWETADAGEIITVTFENRIERTSDLSITKQVDGLYFGDNFDITVVISSLTPGSSFAAIKTGDNPFIWTANDSGEIIRTVSLKENETIIIRNLPIGSKYRVSEADTASYTPSVFVNGSQVELARTRADEWLDGNLATAEQVIHEGDCTSVIVTNTSKTGSLKITKHLAGKADDPEERFPFRIKLTYKKSNEDVPLPDYRTVEVKLNGEVIEAQFINGVFEIELGDNDTLLIDGIYEGADYIVEELDSGIYELTIEGSESGKITSQRISEIIFTNTRLTYSVDVIKTDENYQNVKGATLRVTNSDGELVDEWISDLEAHTLEGLTSGSYTLSEVSPPSGYLKADDIVFVLTESGTILIDGVVVDRIVMIDKMLIVVPPPREDSQPEATLYNLTVTEEIYGEAPRTDEFTFILEFSHQTVELPTAYEVEGSLFPNGGRIVFSAVTNETEDSAGGGSGTPAITAEFTLGHEQEIVIKGLPDGTEIKIVQSGGDERYETKIDGVLDGTRTADRAIKASDVRVDYANGYYSTPETEPAPEPAPEPTPEPTPDPEPDPNGGNQSGMYNASSDPKEDIDDSETPFDVISDTGDSRLTAVWISLALLSAVFAFALLLPKKKKN